ncbi:MAG: histidine phosphatase family protein [bacterium]|nr:histidine phosphatase family protein [bacterium]
MKVYFVRHGESEYNVAERHQHAAVPLSANGKQQAEIVAERFTKIPVDTIISSNYLRALDTAKTIGAKIGKTVEVISLFRERKRPNEIEGLSIKSNKAGQVIEQILENWHNHDWHYSNEENFLDLKNRAQEIIDYLEARTENEILVVTHGGILRVVVLLILLGDQLNSHTFQASFEVLEMANTGITICEKKAGRPWRVLCWSDFAHLG